MADLSRTPTEDFDLSIIIVTYNDLPLASTCLERVFQNRTRFRYEVCVVDNGSSDGTSEFIQSHYPSVELLRNIKNIGYARANNRGIQHSSGRYFLLLNPDTEISTNTIEELVDLMDRESDIGVVGPKLIRPSGEMDYACRRMFPGLADYALWILNLYRKFPQNRTIGRYNLLYLDPDKAVDVDSVAGACLLARRTAVEQIGLLDETYFIYGEDLDWCYRFILGGWRVHYYPKVVVLHHKGGTSRHHSARLIVQFYRSNLRLYRKFVADEVPLVINWAVYTAILIRGFVSYLYNLALPSERKRVA